MLETITKTLQSVQIIYTPMGVDPQKKVEGTPPLQPLPSFPSPLEVGPLNPARESDGAL